MHPKYEGRTIATEARAVGELFRGYYSIDGGEMRAVGGKPDWRDDAAHSSAPEPA